MTEEEICIFETYEDAVEEHRKRLKEMVSGDYTTLENLKKKLNVK